MKIKGIVFIILGVFGAVYVSIYDILMGKPVNDLSGPKSISALIFCGIIIFIGIHMLLRYLKNNYKRRSK